MKKLTTKEIRKGWLDFWKSKDHKIIESKSLIPVNDPSILWINSGVATLKDYFSGKKKPENPRMANSQKSIRTNDIDNVGVTSRHHTFFEMLGNFSIGDYFKDKAIEWAYEYLFEVLGFPLENIYITYYEKDKVTYDKWLSLGIKKDHLIKGTKETNFWDMGEGPCGPDTEIFFDRGEKYDPKKTGVKLLKNDIENDRYIEVWNIVFSELNNDGEDNYETLKQQNIDTGAGLERLASILQDAPTNFETDSFIPIIKEIEKLSGSKYDINNYFKRDKKQEAINKHFRIIADHIRAIAQAINDGAKPSNTQRGYIIRRLLRRAYRSGKQLGIKNKNFLSKLLPVVNDVLDVYPINIDTVSQIIIKEENAFSKTIKQGEELLLESIKGKKELDFSIAFKLFDTYGFPVELTQEITGQHGVKLDISLFDEYKKKHAEESRGKSKVRGMASQLQVIQDIKSKVSAFTGYDELKNITTVVFSGKESNLYYTLLEKTPFYATSGGQQHDIGTLNEIEVLDVFKDKYGNHWHVTEKEVKGEVKAIVDANSRIKRARNHSGTHLLGHALRLVLGKDVVQLGSENNDKRLRFDFPYDHKPTKQETEKIEKKVNEIISSEIEREYIVDTFQNGIDMGALALEGEVDTDPNKLSRIVKFGDSIEFCGGTHVNNSKVLEKMKITKIESKGSGTYRIEAITSNETIDEYICKRSNELYSQINKVIKKLDKAPKDNIQDMNIPSLESFLQKVKELKKKEDRSKGTVEFKGEITFSQYKEMKSYINLNLKLHEVKPLAIKLREENPDALVVLGAPIGENITLAVASKKYNSKEVFDIIAKKHNGRGGGNERFAMGKINKTDKL